jgi:hypothetical protein
VPFVRTAPEVPCPEWQHRKSRVCANGTYTCGGHRYRRYRCRPRTGKGHTFAVLMDSALGLRPIPRWQAPPPCPEHPEARHLRDGLYGGGSGGRRQRYRCFGNGKPRGHAYTPTLPRAYVGGHGFSDPCEMCEEPRGVHRGEQANARRHTWSSQTVAQGLMFLARGEPYGHIGRWAMRVSPPRSGRTVATPTTKPSQRAESNRRWHIAADWVETFSPVFWEPLEAEMRARALAERRRIDAEVAAGGPLRRPIIWVADELSIHGKTDELFSVLVVAEAEWKDGSDEPHLRLRVARAMPDRTTAAWTVVLDELARVPGETDEIWPEFIVADGAKAISRAAEIRFGGRTRWVPSTWHLGYRIREAYLGKDPPRDRLPFEDLEVHLDQLTRASASLATVEGWRAWWDRLAALMPPKSRWVANQRAGYEQAYAAVIPDLANNRIPISNAGLEELIKNTIVPLFYKRTSFTSIERTNRLTDLAICASRFQLDEMLVVARRLRAEAHAHGGWTTALRASSDATNLDTRVRYRSLRDRALASRITYEREIA